MRIEAVSVSHLARLTALFEAASSPCFCRYWHFQGNKNDWLERCAERPEENAAELSAAVRESREDGGGVVAIDGDDDEAPVIGWMKLVRRACVPKLRTLPVYRGLDLGDESATFSVGCFLVHPAHRRRGVARALLEGGAAIAARAGVHALEGYPRSASVPLYDEEAWQGPVSLFEACGFEHVAGAAPYPVYRKVLA